MKKSKNRRSIKKQKCAVLEKNEYLSHCSGNIEVSRLGVVICWQMKCQFCMKIYMCNCGFLTKLVLEKARVLYCYDFVCCYFMSSVNCFLPKSEECVINTALQLNSYLVSQLLFVVVTCNWEFIEAEVCELFAEFFLVWMHRIYFCVWIQLRYAVLSNTEEENGCYAFEC